MKVTEQTSFEELALILRSLPLGARLHLGANKPGDYTAIIRLSLTDGFKEYIAHRNTISESIADVINKVIVEFLGRELVVADVLDGR